LSNSPLTSSRSYGWLLPTLLAALAATRYAPLATPATLVLLCYLPGRYLASGFGIAAGWSAAGRFVLAVASSLAIMPVLLNPLWHLTNDGWWLLAAVWLLLTIAGPLYQGCSLRRSSANADPTPERALFTHTRAKIVFAALAALVAFAAIGTYWPTELHGHPTPALIHDFIKHHAVLFSLEQRPLPLGNPFFADSAAGPVYYYHFFYLIPATLRAIVPGVSIELAFGIQAALVGICTAAMFYLIVKRFTGGDGPAMLAALLATVVGGLDVIPVLMFGMKVITLDAWADTLVRIHNLLTQIVWTPQNVQGLLIILLGVYVLSAKGWWHGWFVLGPLLAAALIGSTVWVAAGVLPGLVAFVMIEVWRKRREPAAALLRLLQGGGVALLMLGLSLPSLLGYLEMSHRHGKGLTAAWPYQEHALLGKLAPPGVVANLLDLPWVLVLEFGPLLLFPLLVPRRVWRRAWDDSGLRLLLISTVLTLAGFVTLRSHFTYNDFGQKIILAAQAAGVILAAAVLSPRLVRPTPGNPLGWTLHEETPARWRRPLGVFIGLILLLGLPVGLYQSPLAAVRRYVLLDDITGLATREAATGLFMRHDLPAGAVLQADPGAERVWLAQIARRQIGVMTLERDTMVFYPANVAAHERTLQEVTTVLREPVAAERCHAALRSHGITHVFVGTIERDAWSGLDKFADERYFECVFEDEMTAVYALR